MTASISGSPRLKKLGEQNHVHVNQRFDDVKDSVNQRFDDMKDSFNQRFDEMNRRISLLIAIAGPLVLAFVGMAVALLQMAFGKS